ncbi:MAG: hypothetical protein HZC49_10825 [Nitrospirae bacterium]|nr:hypothetical protein [Nitrospirota bacterium]
MKMSGLSGPIIFIIATSVFLGCGAGGGGNNGDASGSTAHRSITECYGCHADGLIAKYSGENIFTEWRDSAHGNYAGADYSGAPAYDDLTASTCNACHDDRGDGELLKDYYSTTGISFLGTVNRPLVGCESCHGSGDTHYGVGQMQYPDPDASICGNCHKEDSYHAEENPEGNGIYEAYRSSPHAEPVSADVYADGSATDAKAKCSKCHTDEGARLYKDISGGYDTLEAAAYSTDPVADVSAVQCRTCHDAHDTTRLLKPAGEGVSAEYETCTSCHQNEDDSYHGVNNPGYDASDTTRTIYDTHFDIDTTNNIEGYIIDKSSDRACSDCHNPHNADNRINDEWAQSGHGGDILDSIVSGRASVAVKPWMEYNWKGADRQACQRCHTATGFKNYADGPAAYNQERNVFAVATGREMLYCWGCHSNNEGELRSPGSYVSPRYIAGTATVTNGSATVTGTGTTWSTSNTPIGSLFQVSGDSAVNIVKAIVSTTQITLNAVYTGTSAAGVNYYVTPYIVLTGRSVDPGTGGSTICVSCHSGRQSGEFIKNYPVTLTGKNFGSFNSHYLAAGAIMYRTIGYEFTGRDYSNDISFVHDTIGTNGGSDGDNGPCVGCHMKTDESHSFEVVEGDLGEVTDIKAYTNVCSGCHGNKSSLISTLNTRDTQYNAALSALDTQLQGKGIYWCVSYPYFKTATSCGGAFYTAWPNKDTLGAAFNYNLLKNIPAAYVHNREYTRKLIYDSIDFLDNGALDKSVEATLVSGDAYDYLNGTR